MPIADRRVDTRVCMASSRRPASDGNCPHGATTSAIHSLANRENPAISGETARLSTRLSTCLYAVGATEPWLSTADPHATLASSLPSRYTCRLPMSSPPSRISARLRRAAAAERAVLAQRRERIERARGSVRTELECLERELADIDQHLELLVRIAPSADDQRPSRNGDTPRQQEPGLARVLRGPAIRAIAVRLLAEQEPAVEAIHYRDWYRLLEEHGFAVAGKKPLAVFLTQVSRSPVVRKATSAGVYELDRGAPERLRGELAALEGELREITGRPQHRDATGVQARRRELVRAIGHHERALQEALASLSDGRSGGAATGDRA
jgi:hypothetical protein